MTSLKTGGEIPKEILKYRAKYEQAIKHIEEYINTTSLDKPLKVYRDDGYGILSNIKLEEGKTIENDLIRLESLAKAKKYEELSAELKKLPIGKKLIQERFLSTTFVKENRFKPKDAIRWEFDVPEGTKGTFIETYNDKTRKGKEIEYLIQRNSKLIIENIDWDVDHWYIKAKLIQ